MRTLILLAILITSLSYAQFGENIKLEASNLKFSYQSFDGTFSAKCRHEIESILSQDWKVLCEEGSFKREYSVHLWVTRYTKKIAPKTSIETLYWVTERYPKHVGYSSTNWIHMADESLFHGASLSVGVDNEIAGLYLEIKGQE